MSFLGKLASLFVEIKATGIEVAREAMEGLGGATQELAGEFQAAGAAGADMSATATAAAQALGGTLSSVLPGLASATGKALTEATSRIGTLTAAAEAATSAAATESGQALGGLSAALADARGAMAKLGTAGKDSLGQIAREAKGVAGALAGIAGGALVGAKGVIDTVGGIGEAFAALDRITLRGGLAAAMAALRAAVGQVKEGFATASKPVVPAAPVGAGTEKPGNIVTPASATATPASSPAPIPTPRMDTTAARTALTALGGAAGEVWAKLSQLGKASPIFAEVEAGADVGGSALSRLAAKAVAAFKAIPWAADEYDKGLTRIIHGAGSELADFGGAAKRVVGALHAALATPVGTGWFAAAAENMRVAFAKVTKGGGAELFGGVKEQVAGLDSPLRALFGKLRAALAPLRTAAVGVPGVTVPLTIGTAKIPPIAPPVVPPAKAKGALAPTPAPGQPASPPAPPAAVKKLTVQDIIAKTLTVQEIVVKKDQAGPVAQSAAPALGIWATLGAAVRSTGKAMVTVFQEAWKGAQGLAQALSPAVTMLQSFFSAGLSSSAEGEYIGLQFEEISRQIASLFLPQIDMAIAKLQMLIEWFQNLSGAQQDSLMQIGLWAAGITAVAIVGTKAIAVVQGLALAVRGLSLALASTPVGAIALLVSALAGIALYNVAMAQGKKWLADFDALKDEKGKPRRDIAPRMGGFESIESTYKRIALASRKIAAGKGYDEQTVDRLDGVLKELAGIRIDIGNLKPVVT